MTEEYLEKHGVKYKLITILFDVFKRDIPELPAKLLLNDESGKYLNPNAYYALKILVKQGENPSANKALKLAGGYANQFKSDVVKIKKLVPEEFEPEPVDPTRNAIEALTQELVKTKTAQFKAELEEEERQSAKMLEEQAALYESRLRDLELRLAKQAGELSATKEQNVFLAGENETLKTKQAVSEEKERALKNALTTIDTLTENLAVVKLSLEKAHEAHEVLAESGTQRARELNREIDQLNSQLKQLAKENLDKDGIIKKYQEANAEYASKLDHYRAQAADLESQLKQCQLTLEKEHEQSDLVFKLDKALKPVIDTLSSLESGLVDDKKAMLNLKSTIEDLSSNVLTLIDKTKQK